MAIAEITHRSIRLTKGCGYTRYKAVDDKGEPFTTVSFVWRGKQRIMFAVAYECWYDGSPENKLRFAWRERTLYLRRLAIIVGSRKGVTNK